MDIFFKLALELYIFLVFIKIDFKIIVFFLIVEKRTDKVFVTIINLLAELI